MFAAHGENKPVHTETKERRKAPRRRQSSLLQTNQRPRPVLCRRRLAEAARGNGKENYIHVHVDQWKEGLDRRAPGSQEQRKVVAARIGCRNCKHCHECDNFPIAGHAQGAHGRARKPFTKFRVYSAPPGVPFKFPKQNAGRAHALTKDGENTPPRKCMLLIIKNSKTGKAL